MFPSVFHRDHGIAEFDQILLLHGQQFLTNFLRFRLGWKCNHDKVTHLFCSSTDGRSHHHLTASLQAAVLSSSNGRAIQMSLARCGEEFSIGKLASVLLQFASETRLFEHRAIDNTAWDSSVLNVEHSPDVGCTIFQRSTDRSSKVREASR